MRHMTHMHMLLICDAYNGVEPVELLIHGATFTCDAVRSDIGHTYCV